MTSFLPWKNWRTFLSGLRKKNSTRKVINSHTRATNLVSQFFRLCGKHSSEIFHKVLDVVVITVPLKLKQLGPNGGKQGA